MAIVNRTITRIEPRVYAKDRKNGKNAIKNESRVTDVNRTITRIEPRVYAKDRKNGKNAIKNESRVTDDIAGMLQDCKHRLTDAGCRPMYTLLEEVSCMYWSIDRLLIRSRRRAGPSNSIIRSCMETRIGECPHHGLYPFRMVGDGMIRDDGILVLCC